MGINQTISYGSSNVPILSNNAGITDTGTTLILIASGKHHSYNIIGDLPQDATLSGLFLTFFLDAFQAYQAATGAEADPNIGLLRLTPAQYEDLESLFFKIGDVC